MYVGNCGGEFFLCYMNVNTFKLSANFLVEFIVNI